MSKRTGVKSGDTENGDQGFLSRWSARKTQIARAPAVRNDGPEEQNEADLAGAEKESDEEAALSDNELLEKYELPDPNDITEEAGLDCFFDGKTPERLRQMALRRLWRINPFFGIVDDMVEYGEDYTDAATVIDGMQTAYQAGKGYLQKAVAPEEADEAADARTDDVGVKDPVNEERTTHSDDLELDPARNSDDQAPKASNENEAIGSNADVKDTEETTAAGPAIHTQNALPSAELNEVAQTKLHYDDLSQSKGTIPFEEEEPVLPNKEDKEIRPKRMVFQIKTDNQTFAIGLSGVGCHTKSLARKKILHLL